MASSLAAELAKGPKLKATKTIEKGSSVLPTNMADELAVVHSRVREVDLEAWYPAIEDYTMRTQTLPLSLETATALLHSVMATKYSKKSLTEEDSRLLEELQLRLDEAIAVYGGSAFVKLSSRSPKDATLALDHSIAAARRFLKDPTWIESFGVDPSSDNGKFAAILQASTMSMKVRSGAEAVALLSSSDRVKEDIELEVDGGKEGFCMSVVVRQWCDLPPHLEFRGFVHEQRLKALSQYNHVCHFGVLGSPGVKETIQTRLLDFFETNIKERLAGIPSYIIDFAFSGMDVETAEVVLIELNPYNNYEGNGTDGCLFDWKTDRAVIEDSPDFVFRTRSEPIEGLRGLVDRAAQDLLTKLESGD